MSTVSGLDIANNVEREWRDRLEAAVKAEREACAKLADKVVEGKLWFNDLPAAIRARSTNAP